MHIRSGGFQASYFGKFKFYSCKYFLGRANLEFSLGSAWFTPGTKFYLYIIVHVERLNNLTSWILLYCIHRTTLYMYIPGGKYILSIKNNKTYSAKMLVCLREMKCYRPRTIYSILINSSSHIIISATLFNNYYNFLYNINRLNFPHVLYFESMTDVFFLFWSTHSIFFYNNKQHFKKISGIWIWLVTSLNLNWIK